MLKQRVVTGLSLLTIVLATLLFAPWFIIVAVVMLFFTVAAWEWANLSDIQHPALKISYAGMIAFVTALLIYLTGIGTADLRLLQLRDILGAGCTWWAMALIWVMYYPASTVYWHYRFIKMLMGIFVLIPSCIALIYLSSLEYGSWLFLYVMGIVVTADVGAYVFGKWLGKGKLAPQVSPGKSWAGFWGGFFTSLVYAALMGSQFMIVELSFIPLVIVSGITALSSVLGDLLESMLKRERGIKDSSQLLPGHGGFMDRMDSITAAAPVFTLLALLLQARA